MGYSYIRTMIQTIARYLHCLPQRACALVRTPAFLKGFSLHLCFIFLPFLLLCVYIPWHGHTSLGDDYLRFSVYHLMDLLFSIKNGSFPLYIPGFEGGQSSAALTLGQLYHPIAWLSYLMPGYWSGYALLNITCLRVLSLGMAHLALYNFFRRTGAQTYWAFICSFIVVYNLRMLDCFRFGASLEAYTGFIFTCTSLGYVWLFPERKRYLIVLVLSGYWLICSGHIQMAYYGVVGSVIFAGLSPFFCAAMQERCRPSSGALVRYYAKYCGCMALSGLLSAAYLVPFYFDFMRSNCGRVDQDYNYSLAFDDSNIDILNSLFFPFRSDVYGNFGGSSLWAIVPIIPAILLFCGLVWRSRMLLFILWSICVLIFLCMLGRSTPVHHLMWQYLPFAHSMRSPGRIALFLPMFIATMFVLLWQEIRRQSDRPSYTQRRLFYWLIGMAILYALYTCITITFYTNPPYDTTPAKMRSLSIPMQALAQFTGCVGLACLALWWCSPSRVIWRVITAVCVVAQTAATLYFGAMLEHAPVTPSLQEMRIMTQKNPGKYFLQQDNMMGRKEVCQFAEALYQNPFISDADLQYYLSPPLATVHSRFAYMSSQKELLKPLENTCTAHTLLVEPIAGNDNPVHTYLPPANMTEQPSSVVLKYSSYNRMVFKVHAQDKAFVTINYPYTDHWKAWVKRVPGKAWVKMLPATLYRANSLYLSVPVPAGNSVVEIRYSSAAQSAGIAISLAAVALLWGLVSWYCLRGYWGYATCVAVTGACITLFMVWQQSLYTSANLHEKFTWKTDRTEY